MFKEHEDIYLVIRLLIKGDITVEIIRVVTTVLPLIISNTIMIITMIRNTYNKIFKNKLFLCMSITSFTYYLFSPTYI